MPAAVRSAAVVLLVLTACGGADPADRSGPTSPPDRATSSDEGCADVVGVEIMEEAAGTYRFDVTVRSADTGWDKYADAWEVRSSDGTVLGVRELLHPHENEQPFTRSLEGVAIPDGVSEVVVAARDSVVGFCGETVGARLPDG